MFNAQCVSACAMHARDRVFSQRYAEGVRKVVRKVVRKLSGTSCCTFVNTRSVLSGAMHVAAACGCMFTAMFTAIDGHMRYQRSNFFCFL